MLIECPECGRSISDQAPSCPGCGFQTKLQNRDLNSTTSYREQGEKCPKCKKMTLYKTGDTSTYYIPPETKTVYKANLNPLKPFTLVDKKEKIKRAGYTINDAQKQCTSCGYTTSDVKQAESQKLILFAVFFAFLCICGLVSSFSDKKEKDNNDAITNNVTSVTNGNQYTDTGEKNETVPKQQSNIENSTQIDTSNVMNGTESIEYNEDEQFATYSVDEYKDNCLEVYYEDVQSVNPNLKDKYVKVHVMVADKRVYSDNQKETLKMIYGDLEYENEFWFVGIQHNDDNTTSYVGYQGDVFFSADGELHSDEYKIGEKLILYGKVILNSKGNEKNSFTIMPKYIDYEKE